MLDLPFADGQFDVVIEKATMDVLFVENDSPFDPKEEVKQRVFEMLEETYRCDCGSAARCSPPVMGLLSHLTSAYTMCCAAGFYILVATSYRFLLHSHTFGSLFCYLSNSAGLWM